MGRRRVGPVRLNGGDTWYVRLWVKPEQVAQAGKKTLIRSLKTTDHSEALKRYGAAYGALERELQGLLGGQGLRSRVEGAREKEIRPGDHALTPLELSEIFLGDFSPQDPTHQEVYEAFETGRPLSVSWEEALEVHVKVSNRTRPQPLARSTIYKYKQAVAFFQQYASPAKTTPDVIRQWIEDHEDEYDPVTIAQRFRWLRSIYKSCLAEGLLKTANPFDLIIYKASTPIHRKRRPFTDEELRLLRKELPEVFQLCLTGLRAGEFFTRELSDIEGNFLVVNKKPDFDWRPKTLSSVRRVAIPSEFILKPLGKKYQCGIRDLGLDLRRFIDDPTSPLHSSRHTFITLARRAGCNDSVVEALTGYRKKEGSRSAQMYGEFDDHVLLGEAQKLWAFVERVVL